CIGIYQFQTPGVVGSDNGSIRLNPHSMPQPDAFLRILETHGGQSFRDADRYIQGAPELVAEVAVSSANLDLNVKLPFDTRNGVKGSVAWRVLDREVAGFLRRGTEFERLPLTPPGWYRSQVFPGLWLDPQALVQGDTTTLMNVLQQGIKSPEHADFVKQLQER